jgi:F-type H+-transporting ATPase subunit c
MMKRTMLVLAAVMVAAPAFAADASTGTGMVALAAAIAIAFAAGLGALGQSRGLAAALEGIARNPSASGKLFTPMIVGLALIESLVIYALVIAFMIVGKI